MKVLKPGGNRKFWNPAQPWDGSGKGLKGGIETANRESEIWRPTRKGTRKGATAHGEGTGWGMGRGISLFPRQAAGVAGHDRQTRSSHVKNRRDSRRVWAVCALIICPLASLT